jgi:hypothetical protein
LSAICDVGLFGIHNGQILSAAFGIERLQPLRILGVGLGVVALILLIAPVE